MLIYFIQYAQYTTHVKTIDEPSAGTETSGIAKSGEVSLKARTLWE
jgi:hypothetical protein